MTSWSRQVSCHILLKRAIVYLQSGHLCKTSFVVFKQNGTKQHPRQNPESATMKHKVQERFPISYSRTVIVSIPHPEHFVGTLTSSNCVCGLVWGWFSIAGSSPDVKDIINRCSTIRRPHLLSYSPLYNLMHVYLIWCAVNSSGLQWWLQAILNAAECSCIVFLW